MEDSEGRVEACGGQRGHIESASDLGAPALDVAGPAEGAAVAGDRGEADEHGGLFGRQGADLGEADDQGYRGCESDAGDGGQNGHPPGQARIGGDPMLDLRVEGFHRRFGCAELALDLGDRRRNGGRAKLVDQGGAGVGGGVAAVKEILKGLHERARRLDRAGLEAFAQDRQHPAVDAVGLGQSAGGLGEQARTQGSTTAMARPAAWRLRWAAQ